MRSLLIKWFGLDKPSCDFSQFLSTNNGREDFLGISKNEAPDPKRIIQDMNKFISYSNSADYKIFVEEIWGKILFDLDFILDEGTSDDKRKFLCGAVKRSLDLLRRSYQARQWREQEEQERQAREKQAKETLTL